MPVYYSDSIGDAKRFRIFTDIFRFVRVLDHMFDAAMPSYEWIPSKVLHVRY
jgi:hypothetical protein